MKYGNKATRFFILILILFLSQLATSVYALNRNEVFAEIGKLNTNWNDISINLWINDFENDADPGVLIGDRLVYHVRTDKPAYFTFVFVDAKGSISILKPDALDDSTASNSLMYPSDDKSKAYQGLILQADPLGRETIYLLASDQKLPTEFFNIDSQSDYANYGENITEIKALITRLNAQKQTTKLAVKRYTYLVDSDTQISTRGIRREVSDRMEEVENSVNSVAVAAPETPAIDPVTSTPLDINDINFEYDSDLLTSTGVNQLEILGSELLDRQEQDDMPRIQLTGHTDSIGSADYNMELSEQRSMASKRFLINEFGLPADYIETYGKGESAPVESNDTDAGRAKNRRVEFVIVQ